MVQGVIILTGMVEAEGNQFVSTCRELGTSSCGDSVEEAFVNLEEAIEVHLNALEEVGERDRVFQEQGINILDATVDTSDHGEVPIGAFTKATRHHVAVTV